jgi:hypothetical protein
MILDGALAVALHFSIAKLKAEWSLRPIIRREEFERRCWVGKAGNRERFVAF